MSLFSPDQLNQLVEDTLRTDVPDGHTNAIVGTVNSAGAQIVATFKLSDRWEVTAAGRHDWQTNDTEAGAEVIYSW